MVYSKPIERVEELAVARIALSFDLISGDINVEHYAGRTRATNRTDRERPMMMRYSLKP